MNDIPCPIKKFHINFFISDPLLNLIRFMQIKVRAPNLILTGGHFVFDEKSQACKIQNKICLQIIIQMGSIRIP